MSIQGAFHIPEDDLIQYALGTLKDVQLSQFTAHISSCNECRAELGRIQLDLASFAAIQPASELPAGARERPNEARSQQHRPQLHPIRA